MRLLCALLCLSCSTALLAQTIPVNTGSCLNTEEAALVQMVNNYRAQNGKSVLPASRWLNTTGQWHVWDLGANNPAVGSCNIHSWSAAMPALWQAVCYTPDHAQATQMWNKPRQISGNAYSGTGYENAAVSGAVITAATALSLWQNSQAHREVILNQGAWASVTFRGMGVGVLGNYAVLWFGDAIDASGIMAPCAVAPTIFSNSFESAGF
jgi:hypothetical protein